MSLKPEVFVGEARNRDAVTKMRGLTPPESLDKLAHPLLPLSDIIEGKPASREHCVVNATSKPVSERDFKDGKYPPHGQSFDLRDVPLDIVPSMYEEPFQALLEGALSHFSVVPQGLRDEAREYTQKVRGMSDHPSLGQLDALIKEGRAIEGKFWAVRREDEVALVTRAYQQAFRLNPLDVPAPGHSIVYHLGHGNDRHILPKEGAYRVSDPALEWTEGVLATRLQIGNPTLQSFRGWIVGKAGLLDNLKGDNVLEMTNPARWIYSREEPYNPFVRGGLFKVRAEFASPAENRQDLTASYFGHEFLFPVFAVLSNPNMPTTYQESNKAADQVTKNLRGEGKWSDLLRKPFTSGKAEDLVRLVNELERRSSSVKEAQVLGTVKALLSGLSPESLDYSKWLMVKPDGTLTYVKDAVDEFIAAKQKEGNVMGVEIGDEMKKIMMYWSRACGDAQAQGMISAEGLITSSSELFKPLELERGGEWSSVGTATSYNNLAIWLDSGKPFPAKDPEAAALVLSRVFGMNIKQDMTARDLMLMTRKVLGVLIPIYPNQSTYDLSEMIDDYPQMVKYNGYDGIITLLRDTVKTIRVARPKHLDIISGK